MRIDTKCSIAIHSMLLIALFGDKGKITSDIIARSTGCNNVIIRNILGKLKKNGLIDIARGVGGATMKKDSKDISIWDIYSAVNEKDPSTIIGVHPNPSKDCPVGDCIDDLLSKPYSNILESMKKEMGQYTLDMFVKEFYIKEPDWKEKLAKLNIVD